MYLLTSLHLLTAGLLTMLIRQHCYQTLCHLTTNPLVKVFRLQQSINQSINQSCSWWRATCSYWLSELQHLHASAT